MAEYPVKRAAYPEHPERCQGQKRDGEQCMNLSVEHSEYCPVHGGNKGAQDTARAATRNYRLQRFTERVNAFADNPGVKSLREEIGITRMILEEVLNQCNSTGELLAYSSKIGSMIRDINSLVQSAHKLESSMGVLLDKMAVIQLSEEIVTLLSEELSDTTKDILALVPEEHREKAESILQADLVDKIIVRLGDAMERAHSASDG